MALVSFKQMTAAQFEAATKVNTTFYRVINQDNSENLYIGAQKLNNGQDLLDALFANRIEYKAAEGADPAVSVKSALDDLYAQIGEGGSVAAQITAAIEALDTATDVTIASETGGVVTIAAGISETDGVIGAGSGTAITLAKVATTGAAEDITVADTDNNFTATDLEAVLAEIADDLADSTAAGAVTIESGSSASYAAVYNFYQGVLGTDDAAAKEAKKIGTINIPKDMVITAASVETVVTADVPYEGAVVGDKYIDITIANNDGTHLYIPVNDLVDVYTGSVGSEITVAIDSSNVVSATVNKIASSKIITRAASGDVTEQNLDQKLAEIESGVTSAIGNLDANVTQTAGADGLALSLTEVDGVVTALSGSIAANTYDAYGAAADVLGEASDATTDMTVNGVKNYVVAALTWEEVSGS